MGGVESWIPLEPRSGPARTPMEEFITGMVDVLIDHLEQFGACVIDDFLGDKWGNQVHTV
jgi:hypothetical protein